MTRRCSLLSSLRSIASEKVLLRQNYTNVLATGLCGQPQLMGYRAADLVGHGIAVHIWPCK